MTEEPEGRLVGRYRLEGVLGRGGMGVVHAATDTHLDRRVAVKVVSTALGGSAEFRQRFDREVEALALLDSPHVVAIVDHGEDVDGAPYLVTQLVPGGDLGSLLRRRGPLPVELALRVVSQVAGALRDAHRADVVHRDVKPANVLLRDPDATGDLHAYLCDFGIAQLAADEGLTSTGLVPGTWKYLAPERTRGLPATPASDLYSAGCLLWACLTGRAPYDGSDVEVAIAHQQAPVPQLPGRDRVTRRLNALLRRVLAKDPADRHPDAEALRVELVAVAELVRREGAPERPATDDPTRSPAPAVPDASGDGARTSRAARRRLVVASAAALVLLGAGVGAVVLLDDDRSPADRATAGAVTGDADGDGLGDLAAVVPSFESARLVEARSTGDALEVADEDPVLLQTVSYLRADTTGDGADEYLRTRTSEVGQDAVDVVDLTGDSSWRVDGVGFNVAQVVGDYDGDGADDLAVLGFPGGVGFGSPDTGGAEVRVADGGPADQEARVWAEGDWSPETDHLVIGDLDGDGDDDLLVARPQASGEVVGAVVEYDVLLAEDGAFTPLGPGSVVDGAGGGFERAADLDGDGTDEVLVVVGERATTTVLGLDGDTLTATPLDDDSAPALSEDGSGTLASVQVTDLDGDGRDDLALLRTPDAGETVAEVHRSTGAGFGGTPVVLPLGDDVELGASLVGPTGQMPD